MITYSITKQICKKHGHVDAQKHNKIVIAIILVILALATVTVMYLRSTGEVDLKDSEGRIQKTSISLPVNSIQGEMN